MSGNSSLKLRLPQPTLESFKAFELQESSAQAWADALPLANTRMAAQQLKQALGNLNRVALHPELRFQLLDILRPQLTVVLSNLSKRYLHQPLIVPEGPRQLAELADALNDLAATGYALVAVHTISQRDDIQKVKPARLVCESVHRGLSLCGRNILQALQLHQPVETHVWLTLHQLYALAERHSLTQLPVSDPLTGSSTVASAYLRGLILGCAKPNQLRQNDLAGIYRALQQWSEHIRISGPRGSGMFLVDLANDSPPLYSDMFHGEITARHRHIDTRGLIQHLHSVRQDCNRHDRSGVKFDEHEGIPCNILDHLILSLGTMSQRHFSRTPSKGDIWISIGLSSSHYQVAGGRSFSQLLYGDYDASSASDRHYQNPFLTPAQVKEDEQVGAGGAEDNPVIEQSGEEGYIVVEEFRPAPWLHEENESETGEQRYPVYRVEVVDASPSGYGLEWPLNMISDLCAGNIISLRQHDSESWAIAAVRWVDQPDGEKVHVGVELLSPGAVPYGAIIHHTTGAEIEPLRVLLLPQIPLVGQPHTLITPRAGFKEQQKVTLLREGEEFLIQLQRQVSITSSYTQFDFRYIKQLEEVLAEDRGGNPASAYDSVWSNI